MNNYSTKKGACTLTTDQQPHSSKLVRASMNCSSYDTATPGGFKGGHVFAGSLPPLSAKRRALAQRLNRAARLQGLKGVYTYRKIEFFCLPGDGVFISTADHCMFGIRKGDYIYICLTKTLLNGDWGIFRAGEKNVLGVYSDAGIGRAVVLGERELYEDFEIIGRAVGFYRGFSRASREGREPDKQNAEGLEMLRNA